MHRLSPVEMAGTLNQLGLLCLQDGGTRITNPPAIRCQQSAT